MMKILPLFLFVTALAAPAFAGFFLEKDAVEEERIATDSECGFSFGAGGAAGYYLGAFDLSLEGLAAYRFENSWGIALDLSFGMSDPVHEAGVELQKFVSGADFLGVGASGVLFKKDDEWYRVPRLFLDYGRNMKPWPKAHFALQASIRLSYLVGESLGRSGTYVTKTANTVIQGKIVLVFF